MGGDYEHPEYHTPPSRPLPGVNCSSSCESRDHATYGECMRAKALGKPIIR